MIAQSERGAARLKAEDAGFRYYEKSNPRSSCLDMLTYGTYEIAPDSGSSWLCHSKDEAIIFCMKGKVDIELESGKSPLNYTLSHYDTLYIPLDMPYRMKNVSDEEAELVICQASAENRHEPFYSSWDDFSKDEKRIRHLEGKEVYIMFDVGEKADKLIAGYTIYEPHTRAYPAHNHTDQEEIYIFCKGSGAMEVYKDEKSKTFVTSVDEMDAVTIPLLNYHPVFSQDEELHFIWCIAGERYWVGDKDKDFMKGDKDTLTT
jgi:mannose-6-phosphate isomerase-like protein (cupin superfamily)